ncbi:cation:proton antiporter domain-containing protein, partial [Leisingera sp. JC1]|uniref:cation:proton antiporter domain-containing protein n=1 Tax=Leisingera sp. JC1 TaxID=1855282 RepID=UPI000A784987
MDHAVFFEFAPYHVMLTMAGAVIILAHWLPRLVSPREPAAAPLLILLGMAAYWLMPDSPAVPDPRLHPRPWEVISELTVIVALFAAGLRLDSLRPWKRWSATLRLLLIGMPLTIAAVALLGWGLGGMTAAGAILLGAVRAPTDPVLAGDV